MERIHVNALKQRLERGSPMTLLDVREPWEYDICRIESSINIPMSQIMNRVSELDKDAKLVLICHHGGRSFQVASYLESCGFNDMANLEGGVSAWAKEIDASMPEY